MTSAGFLSLNIAVATLILATSMCVIAGRCQSAVRGRATHTNTVFSLYNTLLFMAYHGLLLTSICIPLLWQIQRYCILAKLLCRVRHKKKTSNDQNFNSYPGVKICNLRVQIIMIGAKLSNCKNPGGEALRHKWRPTEVGMPIWGASMMWCYVGPPAVSANGSCSPRKLLCPFDEAGRQELVTWSRLNP